MQFKDINIREILPQRPPFIMVEKLLHCDNTTTKTSLSINKDNIFVENGVFSQSGIIENVAQTCAARLGYQNRNKPVKIGMIGSINDFEFLENFAKVNDTIFTKIIVETEIGNVILLNADVLCNDKILAQGKMKVVLTDINA
jgi:predicted hotdog family 3-hydroxylacyl-ACP dehydratase